MEYKFSQLFEWCSGKPITVTDGDIPIYGSNGIIGFTSTQKFKNKLILGRVGAYCGSVAYCSGDFNATDNTLITTCDESKIIYPFAYYLLKQYKLNDFAGGSAQPLITQGLLKHLKCNIPDIAKQQRIAGILSKYDEAIENNNKRIKVLEQMAESLYKEWFVRFRFPGSKNVEFEDGIPCGWTYAPIEKLASVLQRGISPVYDDDGTYAIINQKCIRTAIMDIKESQRQSKPYKKELNLQDSDTVICSTGTGTLGRVGQVYGEYENTTLDSHVTLVRTNKIVGKHYLYFALKQLQPWFMSMGIGSTNQQELYCRTIKNAKILVSSNQPLNAAFETQVEAIHKQIIILINANEILIKQRDMLLPRLMSGKLEV